MRTWSCDRVCSGVVGSISGARRRRPQDLWAPDSRVTTTKPALSEMQNTRALYMRTLRKVDGNHKSRFVRASEMCLMCGVCVCVTCLPRMSAASRARFRARINQVRWLSRPAETAKLPRGGQVQGSVGTHVLHETRAHILWDCTYMKYDCRRGRHARHLVKNLTRNAGNVRIVIIGNFVFVFPKRRFRFTRFIYSFRRPAALRNDYDYNTF